MERHLYLNLVTFEVATEVEQPERCWLWLAAGSAWAQLPHERAFLLSVAEAAGAETDEVFGEWVRTGRATPLSRCRDYVEKLLDHRLSAEVPARLLRHFENLARHPQKDPFLCEREAFAQQFEGGELVGLRGFLAKNPRPHRLSEAHAENLTRALLWLESQPLSRPFGS